MCPCKILKMRNRSKRKGKVVVFVYTNRGLLVQLIWEKAKKSLSDSLLESEGGFLMGSVIC